jgi:hypothetical protein
MLGGWLYFVPGVVWHAEKATHQEIERKAIRSSTILLTTLK